MRYAVTVFLVAFSMVFGLVSQASANNYIIVHKNPSLGVAKITKPDDFDLAYSESLEKTPRNETFISQPFDVTGITVEVPISVSGEAAPEYSINGGGFTSQAGTVENRDTVRLKIQSSSNDGETVTGSISVGDGSASQSVTTNAFPNRTSNISGTITLEEDLTMSPRTAQFVDPDGDDLTYIINGSLPSGVSITEISDGEYELAGTPAGNTAGLYSGISIEVSDGMGSSSTSTFAINVEPDGMCPRLFRGSGISTIDQRLTCECTSAQTSTSTRTIWGSGPYTDDSDLCRSAVHAGLLNSGQSGQITAEFIGNHSSYNGTTRNGITTEDYDSFDGYEFR